MPNRRSDKQCGGKVKALESDSLGLTTFGTLGKLLNPSLSFLIDRDGLE